MKTVPNGREAVVAFYGPGGPEGSTWYKQNIMELDLAHKLFYENDNGTLSPVKSIRVHRKAAPSFLAALLAIWLYARFEVKKEHDFVEKTSEQWDVLTEDWLKDRELTDYNGAYNYRNTRGSSALSGHALGIAIDMDASDNPLGSKKTSFPDWYIECWTDQGFFWGGNYTGRKDPMHFILAKGI